MLVINVLMLNFSNRVMGISPRLNNGLIFD